MVPLGVVVDCSELVCAHRSSSVCLSVPLAPAPAASLDEFPLLPEPEEPSKAPEPDPLSEPELASEPEPVDPIPVPEPESLEPEEVPDPPVPPPDEPPLVCAIALVARQRERADMVRSFVSIIYSSLDRTPPVSLVEQRELPWDSDVPLALSFL